jgi:hypothetical protein
MTANEHPDLSVNVRGLLAMTANRIVFVYVIVLLVVSALYVFSTILATYSRAATPSLENAIPIFVDLLKVIVGAAIGSASTAIGKLRG